MKSIKKVLALALALAMVVTAVPVTSAEAATTGVPKTKTYYAGKTYTLKLTTPKSWKSVKSTWSEKSSAVSLSSKKAKSVKVKAIKAGSATVKVKVTYKKSSKKNAKKYTKNYSCKVSVKEPSLALDKDAVEVAIGTTEAVKATVKPSTATVTFASDNAEVATVDDKGTVTGVKAGEANITATAKVGTKTVTATAKVTVKKVILDSVAQTKLTELTAVVKGDTKSLKAADFKVVNTTTKVVYPVSKVSVDSKDATKVTLTLFSELKDADYDVTLEGVTKSFKASDGKVASIAVDPVTIPYATETEIKLVSKDANGVIIKELPYGDYDANYDFTITTNGNGYTNGKKLYLNKVGDTATAEITYKTGKYDQNGKPEGNIGPDKVTITATAQSEVNSFAVRIDDDNKKFDKAKDTNKIAVNETKYAYFMIKNAEGKEISDYSKYTFESSDKATLMLAQNTVKTNNKIEITALKNGTAYILVKKDNSVVGSVAIDVVAERAVATLDLDTYNVSISKNLAGDSKSVNVTLKDQYGDKWDKANDDIAVECLSTDASDVKPKDVKGDAYFKAVNKKVTFYAATAKKGNYTYKIAYKKDGKEIVAKTVSVSIKETTATKASSYRLDVDNNTVDIKVDDNNKTDKKINIRVLAVADGVDLHETKSTVKYTVKKADGTKIYEYDGITETKTNAAIDISSNKLVVTPLKVTSGGALAVKQLDANTTYTVEAKFADENDANREVDITTTFTVNDTQAKAGIEVKDETVEADTAGDAVAKAVVVTYGDNTYTNNSKVTGENVKSLNIRTLKVKKNTDGKEVEGVDTPVSGSNYFTVTKLVVRVEVVSGVYMDVEVSVPGTITIK
ncbi:MAG: Ig-like domain-containing protein [Agathobacter sp.]|nr:Ig-like domain-containing protein [Agathobacter sp.]